MKAEDAEIRLWRELAVIKEHAGEMFPPDAKWEPEVMAGHFYCTDRATGDAWLLLAVRIPNDPGKPAEKYRMGRMVGDLELSRGLTAG